MTTRRLLAIAGVIALAGALTGCAGTVRLPVADDANDPLCAEVSVRLPDSLAGEDRRWTDAQATGAWGDPAAVILSCGVTPPGPTEQQCITIDGVDWIVDDSRAPQYLVTTYGRTPAVQVFVDNETVSPNEVLSGLSSAVSLLPASSECVSSSTLLP